MNRAVLMGAALLLITCRSLQPNQGTFSCSVEADCGEGFVCRPQFSGGGRCFLAGACTDEELCNGSDDTCDGRVDESFPGIGSACTTGAAGVCNPGKQACSQGSIFCQANTTASAERCNGLDDDCNGRVDEAFDLATDLSNCGACGRPCQSGTLCRASSCVEVRCDDGVDNDQNGSIDCADQRCFGLECSTAQAPASLCGFAPVIPDAGVPSDAGLDGGVAGDGGLDGGPLDGGPLDGGPEVDGGYERGCFRPESSCDDGFDNDGDGAADCADSDCDGRTCFSGLACAARTCPGPG